MTSLGWLQCKGVGGNVFGLAVPFGPKKCSPIVSKTLKKVKKGKFQK